MTVLDVWEHYQPHEGQGPIHEADGPIKVLQAARRFGKSRAGFGELMQTYAHDLAEAAPDSLVPPWHAWVVCPSFPQGRQTWDELLALVPSALIDRVDQADKVIYLKGTPERLWGKVELKSADNPDTLQTVGLNFLWVVEAQDVANRAFEKLLPTLRSPHRTAHALFEGIPALYAEHWFQRLFDSAVEGRPGYVAFRRTVYENPLLTTADLEDIERDREVLTEAAWRRMYLAEFNRDAGYFHNIEAALVDPLPMPVPGARYVAGLDLGRKRDPSVLWIGDAEERRAVAHYTWDGGQNWVIQREAVAHYCREWDVERLLVDATGLGDVFVQEIEEMGIPVEPYLINHGSREHLLNTLAVSLERETVKFPPEYALLRQLRAFQFRRLPGGGWRAEAPPDEHDDEVFSMALLLQVFDPPREVLGGGQRFTRRRYLPTQAEAGGMGHTPQGILDRQAERSQRRRERLERAGITL